MSEIKQMDCSHQLILEERPNQLEKQKDIETFDSIVLARIPFFQDSPLNEELPWNHTELSSSSMEEPPVKLVSVKPNPPNCALAQFSREPILIEVNPSQQQTKNTNMVKFIVKTFNKYHRKLREGQDPELDFRMSSAKLLIEERGKKNINLSSLYLLFGSTADFEKQNRQFCNKIFSSFQFLQNDILKSSFIKKERNQKQHLLASKIFRLRCRSAILAQRVQTK